MLLITLIETHTGRTLKFHSLVAFKNLYYLSIRANHFVVSVVAFQSGVAQSNTCVTRAGHAKERLLPLLVDNKSSLRVAEGASVSRGLVRSTK